MAPRPCRSKLLVSSVATSLRVLLAQVLVMVVPLTTGLPLGRLYVPPELREAEAVPTNDSVTPSASPKATLTQAHKLLRMGGSVTCAVDKVQSPGVLLSRHRAQLLFPVVFCWRVRMRIHDGDAVCGGGRG